MQVLIIGTGIAGLTAAILADKKGYDVTLVTKADDPMESNSSYAQGGIVFSGKDDSSELLFQDIETAGAGMTNPEAVRLVSENGHKVLKEILLDMAGVPFSREGDEYSLTGEAAHSVKRILHSGDTTGRSIIESLMSYLENKTSIQIRKSAMVVELITIPHHSVNPLSVYRMGSCLGAYLLDQESGRIDMVFADHVILATGGIGQIYKYSTNPEVATGDGIGLAWRAGARIVNMEYTQFHPTTLAVKESGSFLISEAVRGEGAVLLNQAGKDFISKTDKRASLAPRDIVSRAIVSELEDTGREHVLLSLEKIPRGKILERFPVIYRKCLDFKIDITKEPIPVVPAFHFSCGGILTDLYGRTSLPGLYAIGETACTGLHGANRLASTSLLEGLVFARQAIEGLGEPLAEAAQLRKEIADWSEPQSSEIIDPVLLTQDWATLRSTMWNYVGIIRKTRRMTRAMEDLYELKKQVDDFYRNVRISRKLLELRNAVQTGIIINNSALKNPTSTGCHYRV